LPPSFLRLFWARQALLRRKSRRRSSASRCRNKRIPLQKYDVPGTQLESVIGIAEIAPNVLIGRHTHPGPESGYLLEGEFVLMIDGQPPKPLKAGESYQVPSGAIHDAKSGPNGAKVLAVYIVRKGEPLATPAK
jgi:quercetin dioxygenase-like cupin family protein